MKTASIIVAAALLVALVPVIDAGPSDQRTEPQRYILGFYDASDHRPGNDYRGHRIVDDVPALNHVIIETRNPHGLQSDARRDDNVRFLEEDRTDWDLYYTPNDPLHTHSALWGTHRVGAEAAWDVTLGSTAVKIAVVDSGLNKGHEEYSGQSRVLNGYNFRDDNTDTSDSKGCDWHGTHVTGTLGSTTNNGKGIAGLSQSTILPAKIFGKGFGGCGTTTTAIVNALTYAGDQGAHVSQNSWGGGGSSTATNDAIAYAHSKGTIHVAAAGNDGPCTNCVGQPWKDNPDKTIVVSSIDDGDGFSSFSSQGPEVTLTAPGGGIGSTTSGTSDYHIMSGTSMAAPHVSGGVGLYLAVNPGSSFATVKNALTSSAEDLGYPSNQQGAGLLRADLLVGSSGGGTPNSAPTSSFTYTCNDLACDFDGTGSTDPDGDALTYAWDFGDGATGTGATTSHTFAAGGTYTVTLTVDDGNGGSDASSQSVSVTSGTTVTLLSEDFEDGAANGWTKSSLTNDLWRVGSDCVAPAGGSYQLAFSRVSPDCDYDVGTAEGWAKTATLDASAYGTVTLEFDHFWETEAYNGAYDTMSVQVSSDGGSSWSTVLYKDARDDNPTGWVHEKIDISSYGTSTLSVRYNFDSTDGVSNDYLGWYVDNVVVTGT